MVARTTREVFGAGCRPRRMGRLALLIGVAATLAAGFGLRAAAADEPPAAYEVTAVTVAPGDTLWAFAREIAEPGEDVRQVVDLLIDVNDLPGGAIEAGQQLLLPVR